MAEAHTASWSHLSVAFEADLAKRPPPAHLRPADAAASPPPRHGPLKRIPSESTLCRPSSPLVVIRVPEVGAWRVRAAGSNHHMHVGSAKRPVLNVAQGGIALAACSQVTAWPTATTTPSLHMHAACRRARLATHAMAVDAVCGERRPSGAGATRQELEWVYSWRRRGRCSRHCCTRGRLACCCCKSGACGTGLLHRVRSSTPE